jgi:hypothetical protein
MGNFIIAEIVHGTQYQFTKRAVNSPNLRAVEPCLKIYVIWMYNIRIKVKGFL